MTLDLDRVAFDLDGTILRSNSFACELINYRCGAELAYSDIDDYGFWDDAGWRNIFNETYDLIDKLGLRTAIEPYDNYTPAIIYDLLNGYQDKGRATGKLHIVTYNNEEAEAGIRDWLRLRAGVMGGEIEVHCLGRPEKGRSSIASKAEEDYDIFIDDNPYLAATIEEDYPGKLLLLANTGLNENYDDGGVHNVYRWSEWTELENILLDIGASTNGWSPVIEAWEEVR